MKLKMVKQGWSVKPYQNEASKRAHCDMTHVLFSYRLVRHLVGKNADQRTPVD